MTGRKFLLIVGECIVEKGRLIELAPEPGFTTDGLYCLRYDGCDEGVTSLVFEAKVQKKDGSLRRYATVGCIRFDTKDDCSAAYRVVNVYEYRDARQPSRNFH